MRLGTNCGYWQRKQSLNRLIFQKKMDKNNKQALVTEQSKSLTAHYNEKSLKEMKLHDSMTEAEDERTWKY